MSCCRLLVFLTIFLVLSKSINCLKCVTKPFQLEYFFCTEEKSFSSGIDIQDFCEKEQPTHLTVQWTTTTKLEPKMIPSNCKPWFLSMRNCSLQEISARAFEDFTSLYEVDLSGNKIQKLVQESFYNTMYQNTLINVSWNEIESVEDDAFGNKETLLTHKAIKLDLSHNKLPEFNLSSLGDSILSSLDLSFNKLQELKPSAVPGPQILDLFLKRNSIKDLSRFNFPKSVLSLDLSYNLIEAIPAGVFKGLASLRKLNLSHNNLRHLPVGVFQDCKFLQTLDLSGNDQLSAEDVQTIKELSSLKEFYFEKTQE